ncbi:MAG TPA: energy transducer TonB [Candidatus Acidoferrum sp.]|nr:energy transducer TonB [Candidatus Acidoferrum sp.]
MSNEEKRNSGVQIGTLGGCLIEGDTEQKARERKIKRRALGISIALQSLVLVGLVLTPLLGKTEKLPFTLFTPIPNYYRAAAAPIADTRPISGPRHGECVVCFNQHLSPHPPTQSTSRQADGPIDGPNIGLPDGLGDREDGLNIFDTRKGPTAPEDPDKNKKRRISVGGLVQQAMLVRRVEPIYPPLARQIRHSGQVRLHALIAVDGTIASLEVMDGDPLLVRSALDAVGQWRYQPTLLNGTAVEVETVITVVYTLNQ